MISWSVGQCFLKVSHFQNSNNHSGESDNNNDTHGAWIIVRDGITNSHDNKSGLILVILYTASKQIKLESPGCSGFKAW